MKTSWKIRMPYPRVRSRPALLSCLLVFLFLALCAAPGWAATRRTATGPVSVEEVARGLDTPWGLAFLPGGAFLVTERDGALFHFDIKGRRIKVSGVPKVYAWGQGGLMDVAAARDFQKNPRDFPHFFETLPSRRRYGARRSRPFIRQP